MRQQHRLGALQVRIPRQIRSWGLLTRFLKCTDQIKRGPCDFDERVASEEPKRGRDLVVATARGVNLGAHVARQLGSAPFDRHMNIFIRTRAYEDAAVELRLNLIERGKDLFEFAFAQQSTSLQATNVGFGAHDVMVIQDVVERVTLGEIPESRVH